jgi:hypothetical protein
MCPQAQEQVGHSNKRSNPFQKWMVGSIKLLKQAKIEGPNNNWPSVLSSVGWVFDFLNNRRF